MLVAFGLDSVIELASAGVLMWRLFVELRHGQKFSEQRGAHRQPHRRRIAVRLGGLRYGSGPMATMEQNRRGILLAGLPRCADRHSRHALLGATQDRHCREDWKPRTPGGRHGSRDMRMAVIRGCRQSRGAMACRGVVD